jgi:glycosyltransferase involved in cell wall biosynthesis
VNGSSLTVCLVTQEYPPHTNWGGIATYNRELAREYVRLGHRVLVVSRCGDDAPREMEDCGVMVYRIGARLKRRQIVGRTIDRLIHSRDVVRKIRDLDARHRIDIIETGEVGLDADRLVRDRSFASRLLVQCHGGNFFGQYRDGAWSWLHHRDFAWSFRRELAILRRAARISVPSHATRAALINWGIEANKITRIQHGVEAARFRPVQRTPGPLMVGFAGRLEPLKGIDFLWKVIESLGPKGIRFHLKGSIHPVWAHETRATLERLSPFVTYEPAGDPDEMPRFYNSLDVLLQPSRFENFGLAYIEAMASGLIVFAGRGGGGQEIVCDGITGFLVDPDGSIAEVVQRIADVAARPHAYQHIRAAARDEVLKHYSIRDTALRKLSLGRTSAKSHS